MPSQEKLLLPLHKKASPNQLNKLDQQFSVTLNTKLAIELCPSEHGSPYKITTPILIPSK